MTTYKQDGVIYEQTALNLEEPGPEQLSLEFEFTQLDKELNKND